MIGHRFPIDLRIVQAAPFSITGEHEMREYLGFPRFHRLPCDLLPDNLALRNALFALGR
jgi:hypothetical protein